MLSTPATVSYFFERYLDWYGAICFAAVRHRQKGAINHYSNWRIVTLGLDGVE